MSMNSKERYQTLLDKMNQYNSGEIGITRVAYTNEEQACTQAFMRMCMDAGLAVRMDQCGNVIARREGRMKNLPPVLVGSHLDTVYQGGKFDGVVGVIAALEVVHRLNDKRIITDHPIEVISFACEESSRFGVATLGSKAMTGMFDKEKYRHLKDRNGITLEEAMALCALEIDTVEEANRQGEPIKAFLNCISNKDPYWKRKIKKLALSRALRLPSGMPSKLLGPLPTPARRR